MLENRFLLPLGMIVARIPVGEDNSVWGINLANGLLCGEKNTLAILLGSNTLWGERYFVELLIITCWGYHCCVGSVDRLRWGQEDFVEDALSVAFG